MIEQRSYEWHIQRLGKITGSNVAKLTDKNKNGSYTAKRAAEILTIATERLTGRPRDSVYINNAIQHGIDTEPEVFEILSNRYKYRVFEAGFKTHDELSFLGASPDGYVGKHGIVEIKCPSTTTFVKYVLDGEVPQEYIPQMIAEIITHRKKYALFVAYDPRIANGDKQLIIKYYRPTAEEIAKFLVDVTSAELEIQEIVKRFNGGV